MKHQIDELIGILSKQPETGVNVPRLLTAEFVGMLMDGFMPPLPKPQILTDEDQIGDGNEWGEKLRIGWWLPQQLNYNAKLNTENALRFMLRGLGGTIVDAAVTAAASYDHTGIMQTRAQGRVPKLSTIGYLLGGYDFLHASMAVNSWDITWEGNNEPKIAVQLVNTGYHLHINDVAPAIVPPDPETHHYIHPNTINVTFNDGSVIDLGAEGRILGGSCGLTNNIVVKQMPQDPWLDLTAANPRKTGAYARDIHRGKREAAPTARVSLEDDLNEWLMLRDGTILTSLEYVFGSDDLIGVTEEYFEIAVKYPRLQMFAVDENPDGEDAALALTFRPKKDLVSGGLVTVRGRNGTAAMS